jgi:hypothetical protein
MYDVTMVKDPKPQGFVTFEVDTFDHTEDGTQKDSLKKVRVVQASDQSSVTSTSQARVSRTPTYR